MSQRMTDEQVRNTRRSMDLALDFDCVCADEDDDAVDATGHVPFCAEREAETAVNALVADHDRARSEEARLMEENRKKDDTIKALADALELAKRRLADPPSQTIRDRMEIDAALRLAGRIP